MTHDDKTLEWLVESRNKIQMLMLDLHRCAPSQESEAAQRWQIAVGAAFSLWRAVFLASADDIEGAVARRHENARLFSKTVIETNTISFSEDRRRSAWSTGYYLNNARFRLGELTGRTLERSDGTHQSQWEECFNLLTSVTDKLASP